VRSHPFRFGLPADAFILSATSLFDRLPDELIEAIAASTLPAVDFAIFRSFALNKRIYRVVKPVLASQWRLGGTKPTEIAENASLRELVRSLRHIADDLLVGDPLFDYSPLASFINLRNLDLVGVYGHQDGQAFPTAFTDNLAKLSNLRHLRLWLIHPYVFEDRSFTIGSAFPFLESLSISRDCRAIAQLLKNSPSSLHTLKLPPCIPDDCYYSVLPWSSLASLGVSLSSTIRPFRPFHAFNASLCKALETCGVRPSHHSYSKSC
jgi:hypothetical protein